MKADKSKVPDKVALFLRRHGWEGPGHKYFISLVYNAGNLIQWGIIMATILYAVFIAIALYVLNGMAFMKLAQKAGRGDIAWMAWVPVCNVIQQLLLIKKAAGGCSFCSYRL